MVIVASTLVWYCSGLCEDSGGVVDFCGGNDVSEQDLHLGRHKWRHTSGGKPQRLTPYKKICKRHVLSVFYSKSIYV